MAGTICIANATIGATQLNCPLACFFLSPECMWGVHYHLETLVCLQLFSDQLFIGQYPAPAPSPRHAEEGPSLPYPYPRDAFCRWPAASPQASLLPRLS